MSTRSIAKMLFYFLGNFYQFSVQMGNFVRFCIFVGRVDQGCPFVLNKTHE